MNKLLLLTINFIFFLLISSTQVKADVIPRYSDNIRHTGIGAFNAPNEFNIYTEPDEKSSIIYTIKWNKNGLIDSPIKENEIFVSFALRLRIKYFYPTINFIIYYAVSNIF